MATKVRIQFVCSECGSSQMKWMGRCPDCGEWNTLQESRVQEGALALVGGSADSHQAPSPLALPDIPSEPSRRIVLDNAELNRVLGGGIVPGSGILVGGDPGIGKSTLLIQTAAEVASKAGQVLYVSAEESAYQIGQRASRLGLDERGLLILADTILEQILEQIGEVKPSLVIVDSVAGDPQRRERKRGWVGVAGTRLRGTVAATGQTAQCSTFSGGTRDQGGGDCGPSCAGAYGGRGSSDGGRAFFTLTAFCIR